MSRHEFAVTSALSPLRLCLYASTGGFGFAVWSNARDVRLLRPKTSFNSIRFAALAMPAHTHLQPQTDMQMQEEEEGTGPTRHGQNGQSSKPNPSYTTDQRTAQLVNPMFFFPFVKNCHELRIP
jgi:hypothetical protein